MTHTNPKSRRTQRPAGRDRSRRLFLILLFTLLLIVPVAGAALNLVRTVTPSVAGTYLLRTPQTAWHALNGDGDAVFWTSKQEQSYVGIASTNGANERKLICFIGGDITDCRYTAAMWTTDGFLAVTTQGGTNAYVLLIYDPDNFTTSNPVASCAFAEATVPSVNDWELIGNTPFWRFPRDGATDGFVVKRGGGYHAMAAPAVGEHMGTCTNLWNENEDVGNLHVSVATDTFWWGSSSDNANTMERRHISNGQLDSQTTLGTRPRIAPAWGTSGNLLDAVHVVSCFVVDPGTCTGSAGDSQLKKYFWGSGAPALNATIDLTGTFDRLAVATDNVNERVFAWAYNGATNTGEGYAINGATETLLTGTCVVNVNANIRLSHPQFQGTNLWFVTTDQQSLRLCETTAGEAGGGEEGGGGGVIPPGDPGGEGGGGGDPDDPPPAGETPTSGGIIAFLVTAVAAFFAVGAETAGFILGSGILAGMVFAGAKRGLLPFAALAVIGGGLTWMTGLLPLWVVLVIVLLGLAAAARSAG